MSSSSDPFIEHDCIVKYLHVGDLIEIDRGKYRHWAICEKIEKKNIWCFHVAEVPRNASKRENASKFEVRLKNESLKNILNYRNSKCRINNQIAKAEEIMKKEKIKMPNINVVIEMLHNQKDQILEYNPKDKNCEHYVTSWKYGIGFSCHSKNYHKLIDIGFGTAIGISGSTALGSVGLTLAGFTSSGIAGGSFAAAWMSSIGNVAAGSTFATLQTLGATGTIAAVGTGAAIVTAPLLGIAGVYYYFRNKGPAICEEYTKNSD